MIQLSSNRIFGLPAALLLPWLLAISPSSVAAGHTLRLDNDSNSRIVIENAVIKGDETTILFWTWPYLGDPNSGKPCPLNFYSLTLRPGLQSVQPAVLAKGVCGGIVAKAGMTERGDALIVIRDRLERWRGGEKISSQTFSSLDATSELQVTTDNLGAQFYDVSQSGSITLAIPVGDHIAKKGPGTSLIAAGLKPDGEQQWQIEFSDVGETYTIEQVWAGRKGDALLYISSHNVESMMAVLEPRLRVITPGGKQSTFNLTELEEQFDFASIRPGSQEDLEKFYAHQRNSKPENIETLAARPLDGGGFDVLFHREGGAAGRAGHFLYRFGPDGGLQSEIALGSHIDEYGLEEWFDFYVSGDQLVLLSRALVTQQSVNAKRKKWMQNVVSRVDLETGVSVSRLIPLDGRYLEAAMNAGDEGQQYLEGQPGGTPAMLTSVGGVPLSVGLGWLRGRFTIRLNEATDDLMAFTEAYDERHKSIAREHARAAQQDQPAQQSATPANMNAQIAAAMAAAQKQLENDPNISPEMRAQMAAIMGQMGQSQGGSAQITPGVPVAQPQQAGSRDSAPSPETSLKLDTNLRGFLKFENEDGHAITLLILNRQTSRELMKKDYPGGSIYEYIDFSQFGLPLEKISVTYREKDGEILKDLTPVIAR